MEVVCIIYVFGNDLFVFINDIFDFLKIEFGMVVVDVVELCVVDL